MLREALTASSLGKEVRYGKALHLKLFKLASPTDSAEEAVLACYPKLETSVMRVLGVSRVPDSHEKKTHPIQSDNGPEFIAKAEPLF